MMKLRRQRAATGDRAKRLTIGFGDSGDLCGEDDEDSGGRRPREIDQWVSEQWASAVGERAVGERSG
ncbi:hypothetical protein ACOSQ2_032786 [Xanthoceras sorbifolium]